MEIRKRKCLLNRIMTVVLTLCMIEGLMMAGGSVEAKAMTAQSVTVDGIEAQNVELTDMDEQYPAGTECPPGSRALSDGDYHIVSALTGDRFNPGRMCLTISGLPNTVNSQGESAELWSVLGYEDHVFTVTWLENGYYKIKLKNSDSQALDVTDASLIMGTNVRQWDDNGSDSQQWVINTADNGGYTIQAKCNGWYLNVADGIVDNGTNIMLWEENGSNAQKWYFVPWCGGSSAIQEIPNGEYEILPKLDNSKIVQAVAGNVELGTRQNNWQQTFQVTYLGDGYYKILYGNSDNSLNVADAGNISGTNVGVYDGYRENRNEKWIIRSCGDGYYNIISQCNGLYLDLYAANTDNGTNIMACVGWQYIGSENQQWELVPFVKTLDLVERFYTELLKRKGDEKGIRYWSKELETGAQSAMLAGYNYVNSVEFKGLYLNNDEYLERLYRTFMDRDSDPEGKAYWLERLDAGFTRDYVYLHFAVLPEFTGICEKSGIRRGEIDEIAELKEAGKAYVNQNLDITQYVRRCYDIVLEGREADPDGMEFWCGQIITGAREAKAVAEFFVQSDEFAGKNTTDAEYVEVLYRAFFGRPGDPDGKDHWLGQLANKTMTRDDVLRAFSTTEEFAKILAGFGL